MPTYIRRISLLHKLPDLFGDELVNGFVLSIGILHHNVFVDVSLKGKTLHTRRDIPCDSGKCQGDRPCREEAPGIVHDADIHQ
jgi:hypothetical protein